MTNPKKPLTEADLQRIEQARQERFDRQRLRDEERKERAAKTLRENLMKRKQQSRARRAGNADETSGLPAAKTDESC